MKNEKTLAEMVTALSRFAEQQDQYGHLAIWSYGESAFDTKSWAAELRNLESVLDFRRNSDGKYIYIHGVGVTVEEAVRDLYNNLLEYGIGLIA